MPNLCSALYGNQIENLPPGVFTNNTELTYLWVKQLQVHF